MRMLRDATEYLCVWSGLIRGEHIKAYVNIANTFKFRHMNSIELKRRTRLHGIDEENDGDDDDDDDGDNNNNQINEEYLRE